MQSNFCGILSHQIDEYWPHVEGLITAALNYGTAQFTIQEIKDGLKSGAYQCWMAWSDGVDMVCLTQIKSRKKKVCNIILCTGQNREKWVGYVDVIEAWAREQGCSQMGSYARPGWEKFMKKNGFRKRHVHMVKELGDV
jgi:hypothetical protein